MKNLLSSLIVIFIFGLFSFIVYDNHNFQIMTPSEKVNWVWKKDVEQLTEQNKLPKAWKEIKSIKLLGGDKKTKSWLKFIKPPVYKNPSGKYELNILITSWGDQSGNGVVLIHSLKDIKTQNLIWELGRTYTLSENNAAATPKGAKHLFEQKKSSAKKP